MKKTLILSFALLLNCILLFSQNSEYYKGRGYQGYAFNKDFFVFMSIENQKERYTPTKQDIKLCEEILKRDIDELISSLNLCTSISKNTLRKYRRQYVGFVNKDGDIIIWINMLYKRSNHRTKAELSNDIIDVLDGGEDYWNIYVNVTKKYLYKLQINGIA